MFSTHIYLFRIILFVVSYVSLGGCASQLFFFSFWKLLTVGHGDCETVKKGLFKRVEFMNNNCQWLFIWKKKQKQIICE